MQHSKSLYLYFHSILTWLGLVLFTLGGIYAIEALGTVRADNYSILVTFIVIGTISISGIAIEVRKRSYSMNLVHWLFFFVFFFLAPLCQYLTDRFPIRLSAAADASDILYVNLLLIIWAMLYGIAYHVFSVLKPSQNAHGVINSSMSGTGLRVTPSGIQLALLLSLVSLAFLLGAFGWSGLTTRASYTQILYGDIESSPFRLVISTVVRAIPVLTLAALLVTRSLWKRRAQWWMLIIIVAVITSISNNPLGAARYWSGSLLLGFAVLLFLRKYRSGVWFVLILMVGLFIVAPTIKVARVLTAQELSLQAFSAPSLIRVLTSGDLDAYEMMVHTVQFIHGGGAPTWGHQLVGTLLFWIPRSLWPSKPISSGTIVASAFGFPNINVSCPLPAEGYINFGIVGLIIFAVGLGWLLSTLDRAYWGGNVRSAQWKDTKTSFLSIIYPFLLGFLLFIMRGSMMSGVSHTIMFIIGGIPLLIRSPLWVRRNVH